MAVYGVVLLVCSVVRRAALMVVKPLDVQLPGAPGAVGAVGAAAGMTCPACASSARSA